ncbi:MAG TPA: alpha-amylase family glycosyl hydrolase [Candidatus Dormibacteraeota bacterium]|nr:alpha-amylase family glycosyl hydrolase [Candidatus Dormibacteraeota bacterium]
MTAPGGDAAFGATVHDGGVAFRVWAPNASAVTIQLAGATAPVPMTAQSGGCWTADVPGLAAGARYVYDIQAGGQTFRRVDPYAREIDVVGGVRCSVAYDPRAFDWGDAPYVTPGWSELVVYELHVGTFNELPGQQVGTFDDAVQKLPYLADLGIAAVELLPPSQFDGTLSWGYNPTDPFAVETVYGGPDGLKAFIRAAHALGIAVLVDVVYNHMGTSNNDLWDYDGPTPPPGGIWFYPDWRGDTGWGSRPDYGRPEVRRALVDNALSWLEEYRADGLRFDATAWIRSVDGSLSPDRSLPDGWRVLQMINDATGAAQPWKIRIAEDMRNDWAITTPTGDGGAGFSAQWDPSFVVSVRGVLCQERDEDRDMGAVRAALEQRYGPNAFARVVFTESHDADANGGTRVPSAIDPGDPQSLFAKKRSILGSVLALTAPGIPMMFQGQEFLETHWFDSGFPVDWANAQRHAGILALHRDLVRLRRDWWSTSRGLRGQGIQVHHVNDADKVVAYRRWDAGGPRDDTVVVVNLANRAYDGYVVGVPREGTWRVRLNTDWTGYDPAFGGQEAFDTAASAEQRDGMPCSASIGIGAYTAVILSQDS